LSSGAGESCWWGVSPQRFAWGCPRCHQWGFSAPHLEHDHAEGRAQLHLFLAPVPRPFSAEGKNRALLPDLSLELFLKATAHPFPPSTSTSSSMSRSPRGALVSEFTGFLSLQGSCRSEEEPIFPPALWCGYQIAPQKRDKFFVNCQLAKEQGRFGESEPEAWVISIWIFSLAVPPSLLTALPCCSAPGASPQEPVFKDRCLWGCPRDTEGAREMQR